VDNIYGYLSVGRCEFEYSFRRNVSNTPIE
jgi:hypothetical protein